MAQEAAQLGTERMDRRAVGRSVLLYTLILAMVQVGIAWLLGRHPGPPRLGWFYLASAVPWTLLTGLVLRGNIHLLYTLEGRPLRRLNLATRVTLIRVLSVPLVFHLILVGRLFESALVFLGAALTDWLDGFLARRMHDVTQLGRIADPSIDALFCGITFAALAWRELIPLGVLVLVLIRYGVLLGGAAALKLVFGYLPVRATFSGRLFYFVQYCLLVLLLLFHGRPWAIWLPRLLGAIQAFVTIQLLFLGRSLYREARRAA